MGTSEMGPVGVVERNIQLTPERAHGEYEVVRLFSDQFVKTSQIRPGHNVVLEEMKDSIETVGLMNPIDVARVDHHLLCEYIDFTNQVWRTNVAIDSFTNRAIDGCYYLICAGHSRHESISELEAEGRLPVMPIVAKVHEAGSVLDILMLQDAENVHSRPPIERRSMVAVEAYLWGKAHGEWSSVAEFAKRNKLTKHKTGLLNDALLFVNLPVNFREFVFTKKISFAAGTELARSAGLVRQNIIRQLTAGDEIDDADVELTLEIEEEVNRQLVIKTNTIIRSKLNSSASVRLLKAWQTQLAQDDSAESQPADSLFDIMVSPREMLRQMTADSKRQIRQFFADYSHRPSSSALQLLELNFGFMDDNEKAEVLQDYSTSAQKALRIVGAHALLDVGREVA